MRSHPGLTKRIAASEPVAITIVSRLEILQGRIAFILKVTDGPQLLRAEYWLRESEEFLKPLPCLHFDTSSADIFDRPRADKRLRKIGRAVLLIASITLAYQATLVTRNLKHFRQVPGLTVENWVD
jgi:tRNA(fMet)-specific endonuclease VapC